jgi:hypothetical protein
LSNLLPGKAEEAKELLASLERVDPASLQVALESLAGLAMEQQDAADAMQL